MGVVLGTVVAGRVPVNASEVHWMECPMKWMLFACGFVMGLASLSVAMGSVPKAKGLSRVTDDTAIYQSLSEIRVAKQGKINFDSEIAQLNRIENRYQEKLPDLAQNSKLRAPMKRISQQKYRYSGVRPAAKSF